MREFKLPDVGEGVAEGEIVQWLVSVGDRVEEDQPVAEVETDKALVEVPSPVDGVVRELRAEEGEMVPVGEVFVVFEVDGEESPADTGAEESFDSPPGQSTDEEPAAPSDARGEGARETTSGTSGRVFAPPRVRRLARDLGVDLATVEGSGDGGRITEQDVRAAAEGGGTEQESGSESGGVDPAELVSSESGSEAEQAASQQAEQVTASRERTLAAPATRQLARELGVDLDRVPPTEERDGQAFVSPEAVRAFAEQSDEESTETVSPEDVVAGSKTEQTEEGEVERVPYRGLRRTIGQQMERSAYTAPHVTHHDEADAERLVEVRERLKPAAEEHGVTLTYMPFVLKAVVSGLREFPDLNAELDEEAEEVVRKQYYNLGIATATDAGLMVPVVNDVDEKGVLELASSANELAAKARDRSIAREEMQGGTFTITNFGAIGGEYATPIINYPEVAILGLGSIEQRARVIDGEVVPRHTLPLSLSIDHRVVDGAVAARFANHVIECLEEPARLLL